MQSLLHVHRLCLNQLLMLVAPTWSSGGRKPQFGLQRQKNRGACSTGTCAAQTQRYPILPPFDRSCQESSEKRSVLLPSAENSPDSRTQSRALSLRQGPPEDTHSIVLGPILFIQSPSVHYIFKSLQSPVFSSPPWMPATLDTSIPFSICWDLSFQGFLFKNKLVENIGFPSKPAGSAQDARRPSCTNADICRHFQPFES